MVNLLTHGVNYSTATTLKLTQCFMLEFMLTPRVYLEKDREEANQKKVKTDRMHFI